MDTVATTATGKAPEQPPTPLKKMSGSAILDRS
jgi:hypothetical protein